MMGNVSTAVAAREQDVAPAISLRRKIENTGPEFARVLPAHLPVEHFVRSALTLLHRQPKLAECEESSVVLGLLDAARLGLEIADQRGQAYLIPRWDSKLGANRAVFQVGYRGAIDLAARAGIIVTATEIREYDQYQVERGTSPRLVHVPPLGHRGDVIGYYAVASMPDGRTQFEVLTVAEVADHRDRFASQRKKDGTIWGPWVDDFDAMARKTLIIKVLNYLPQAFEFRKAMAVEADGFEVAGSLPVGLSVAGSVSRPLVAELAAAPADPVVPSNVDVVTGEVVDLVEESDPTLAAGVVRPVDDVSSDVVEGGTSATAKLVAEADAYVAQNRGQAAAGDQTPLQMIVGLARAHGVEGGDDVARMCTQIVGREVVSPTGLKPPEVLKVRRFLQGLGEDAEFVFVDRPVPVEVSESAVVVEASVSGPVSGGRAMSDPEGWSDGDWRQFLKSHGVKVTAFAPVVARLGRAGSVSVVTLDEIAGKGIADDLVGWVLENSTCKS